MWAKEKEFIPTHTVAKRFMCKLERDGLVWESIWEGVLYVEHTEYNRRKIKHRINMWFSMWVNSTEKEKNRPKKYTPEKEDAKVV
jgi:hypothetical protein